MQCLSADPRIANRLNEPVNLRLSLRGKYNVPGTLADFLIVRSSVIGWRKQTDAERQVSIYTLVFTTKARLSALYPAFVLTIANASPYFKNLSVVSSTRLLQLFLAFSAPQFLLMEEGNPRLVYCESAPRRRWQRANAFEQTSSRPSTTSSIFSSPTYVPRSPHPIPTNSHACRTRT